MDHTPSRPSSPKCADCLEPFEEDGDRAPSPDDPTCCNACLDENFAAGGHYSTRMMERAIGAAENMGEDR